MADNEILKKLRDCGLKCTPQRKAVIEVLTGTERPLSAREIFSILQERGENLWFSTVYRTLEVLSEKSIIEKQSVYDQKEARYELRTGEHHHHAVCTCCQSIFDITDCPLDDLECILKKKLDFETQGHRLEIFGLCSKCRR